MRHSMFRASLIFSLALIVWAAPFATDAAYSWGRDGTMIEGVSQSQIDAYRFGAFGYQGAGFCGPPLAGPPPFAVGAPPVPYPRGYPGQGLPPYGTCE
ncbi:MAG: hypothetical protein HY913_05410 [Desulfomonile tiedjei]|nr:hypothetical protein [Desulfomonile tiedjei]